MTTSESNECACIDSSDSWLAALSRFRSAMIPLALVSACSSSAPAPPTHRVSVTLTIGALDDPQYALTRVEAITTASDGNIFVLQHEDGNVREYDSNGQFV